MKAGESVGGTAAQKLLVSGNLKGSVSAASGNNGLATVGTNLIYAPGREFGDKRGRTGKTKKSA